MTLAEAGLGKEYSVREINSDDEELVKFLFSLGCYSGERVTVLTRRRKNIVLEIRDARYSIDTDLAKNIMV